ncbi:hypothetical protein TorRG33x02_114600 [Trema orientale]|uniref:Uncharacterized protein n=1 Tax=Trema orientale TaxID=63057 RepID=A0A2P5F4Z7_TREOI|nr:hypothetical protein TorRG33x02_114600 [Trema orientale]
MLPQQIKIFILMYLLLINSSFSAEGADHDNFKGSGMKLTNTPDHELMLMKAMNIGRKLLITVDAMLDYQDPGANPVHDPHKGH